MSSIEQRRPSRVRRSSNGWSDFQPAQGGEAKTRTLCRRNDDATRTSHSILLGVNDMERSKRFYAEGLGWEVQHDYKISVFFVPHGGSLVASTAATDSPTWWA